MLSPRIRCLAIALVLPLAFAHGDDYISPAQARLKADVAYLADDAREGRGPGTKGLDASADYIANTFKELGLKTAPGADGYFQNFELGAERRLGEPNKLVTHVKDRTFEAAGKADFSPLALGGPGELKDLPVVFAGYGITAKEEGAKLRYDDYDGIDAKDKAVLIIRRRPQQDKDDSDFGKKADTPAYATFNHKVANATSHGAKAILLVNDGFSTKEKDELLDYQAAGGGGTARILVYMISRDYANKLLKAAGQPELSELEAQIDSDLKPRSRALEGVTVDGTVTIDRKPLKVKNVIGVLEGSGPLSEETIVVGGHYDHLGYGGFGSLAFGNRSIHNGADDNASGTATVMEMARRLARRTDPLPRRVVFMLFSAEERGLIGSDYYVKHPLYPLDKTVAMVNFDMVGRLNTAGDLLVYGANSSPGMESLVESLSKDQAMKPKMIGGTGGEFAASDHYSFYRKDIPVVFFFTGTHPDYHRPTDDTNLINFEGMVKVADVGELLLLDVARRPERPKFVKLQSSGFNLGGLNVTVTPTPSASRSSGVYLGTQPSYADVPEGGGVKLDGVTAGSPAEKGGIKAGDIIIKFDGKDVKEIESYMAAMSTRKPGDEVEIIVKRDGKEVPLKVKLGTRPTSTQNR